MLAKFDYGTEVRLTRNVRNDGTYPGEDVGRLLIRRGEVGVVHDVGTYLQDQIIYRVNFIEAGKTVGCREEELVDASEPWVPNKFEFRDKVVSKMPMRADGEMVVQVGDEGEIIKMLKQDVSVFYHVRFNGRTFQVPESSLAAITDTAVSDID